MASPLSPRSSQRASATLGSGGEQRAILLVGLATGTMGDFRVKEILALSFEVAKGAAPTLDVPIEQAGVRQSGTDPESAVASGLEQGQQKWSQVSTSRAGAEALRLTFMKRNPHHHEIVFGPNEWRAAALLSGYMAARGVSTSTPARQGAHQGFTTRGTAAPSAASITLMSWCSEALHYEFVGALAMGADDFDGKRRLADDHRFHAQ